MTFRHQHEFLHLGKETNGFSKNYFYEWDDGLGGPPAQVFLNFQIQSSAVSGEEIGDLIFEVMKNHFFHDLEREPSLRFEDTLKEINHMISQKEEELSINLVPLMNVICAAITDGHLFLSQRGDAEAYLIRRRFLSPISEGLSDARATEELFSNIANGVLLSEDVILLSSRRLLRYVTKSDLAKLFSSGLSLSQCLDSIKELVSLDLTEAIAVLGVQVGEKLQENLVIEGRDEDVQASGKVFSKFTSSISHLTRRVQGHVANWKQSRASREIPQESPQPSQERFEQDLASSRSARFPGFLSRWQDMRRDKILALLVAAVVLLSVGIYVVRNQGLKQKYIEELEAKLVQVETNINTAQTTGSYDKSKANILLNEAETLALEVLNSGYLRGKASEYLERIDAQRDQIENVTRLTSPKVFLDFSSVNPTMNAFGMVSLGDRRFVYDAHQLYEIILDEIQTPVTIDSDETIIDAAYFDDNESILFLTKSSRILEYVNGQFSFLDTEDGSWHSAVDLEVYNNRIYLLDPSQNQIWRYTRQRDGFSTANPYLVDTSIDLTQAVSFTIDGSVFVLKEDGSVLKLFGGENENLLINKAPDTDISGATKINTEFEQFQVFILDPAKDRILVYNKDAKSGNLVYNKQFVLDNAEELRALFVDKDASKVYVVGETEVYEVEY